MGTAVCTYIRGKVSEGRLRMKKTLSVLFFSCVAVISGSSLLCNGRTSLK